MLCTKFEIASFYGCRNISKRSHIFLDASIASSLGFKKSLDSTYFAEISRGPKISGVLWASVAQTPDKFGPESCFGKLLPKPKLYTKFEVACFSGCRNK